MTLISYELIIIACGHVDTIFCSHDMQLPKIISFCINLNVLYKPLQYLSANALHSARSIHIIQHAKYYYINIFRSAITMTWKWTIPSVSVSVSTNFKCWPH